MTKKEREKELERLYDEGLMDEYVALLTNDWTDHDWKKFNQAMNQPIYDEWNDKWMPSYVEQYG